MLGDGSVARVLAVKQDDLSFIPGTRVKVDTTGYLILRDLVRNPVSKNKADGCRETTSKVVIWHTHVRTHTHTSACAFAHT